MTGDVERLQQVLAELDRPAIEATFQAAAVDMDRWLHFLDGLLVPALEGLGRAWELGEVSLSQLYLASRVCEQVIEALPLETEAPVRNQPRLGIAVLVGVGVLVGTGPSSIRTSST